MEKKLICGRPHVRIRCAGCGEWFWVAKASRQYRVNCDSCYHYGMKGGTLGRGTGCKQSGKAYQGDCKSG